LAVPGSDGSVISNSVTFDKCTGSISGTISGTSNDTWEFKQCEISSLNSAGSLNSINVYIKECIISGANCGGASASEKWHYYNNNIIYSSSVNLGSRAILCVNNTVTSSGGLVGRTIGEWWSYRDPSVFRTS
ncbi:hypothetical protein O2064_001085, partial [Enterobacter hormaechei]|nr:hypothetical protein [Enterobacter hormaechei]